MSEVVALDFTADEAREFVEHVRASVEDLKDWIVRAVTGRAWIALGYGSWDEMCEAEFDGAVIRLPREDRREAVASLREAGLSTRAIGSALGVDQKTVVNDVRATEEFSSVPETVTSLDGRQRPATQTYRPDPDPEPEPEPGGPDHDEKRPDPEPGIWYSGPTETADTARLDAELDAAMEGTVQRFRSNFARASVRAGEVTTFDADRIAEVFAANWNRDVGDLVRQLREWCDDVESAHRRQSSGLRIVKGGAQ